MLCCAAVRADCFGGGERSVVKPLSIMGSGVDMVRDWQVGKLCSRKAQGAGCQHARCSDCRCVKQLPKLGQSGPCSAHVA
jgi:hypothetical protein